MTAYKEIASPQGAAYHWGYSTTLAETPRHTIQEKIIKSSHIGDIKTCADKSSYWIVNKGEALFMVDGCCHHLKEKGSIFIKARSSYVITNPGEKDLRLFYFECAEERNPPSRH